MSSVCLNVVGVSKTYSSGLLRKRRRRIFEHIGFSLRRGETVGIVGRSGAGKTTLGKIAAGILAPSGGRVEYGGTDISAMDRRAFSRFRRSVQMVFQDPEGALNPMKRIERQLLDVCTLTGTRDGEAAGARIAEIFDQVGLSEEILSRLPRELSGGQNQRVVLGKILLLEPEIIVLDEPTSALDISVQASILHLLKNLQRIRGLSYLFISHEREIVRFMCDRVYSLDRGKEEGELH
jgi:peptide/nickel transport system ATP-binding protein